jgi:hypothetical protein
MTNVSFIQPLFPMLVALRLKSFFWYILCYHPRKFCAAIKMIIRVKELNLKNTCILSENGNFGSAKVLKYKKGSASQKAWEPLI